MKATSLRGLVIMAVLIFMSVGAMAQTTIVGWDFNGLIKSGSLYNGTTLPATTTAGGLTTGGLFRGNSTFMGFASAVVTNYSENAYGGYPTNAADSTTAITGGKYIYFKVQAATGNTLSLSNFQMYYRVQPTTPTNGNMKVLLQYSVGTAAFQSIEQISVGALAGPTDQLYSTSLSGFSALQGASDSIRFRLVVYGGANASPGASFWLTNGATGNDLVLSGTVGTTAPACASITPGTISSNTTGNAICSGNSATLSLNNTAPVTGVNYQWMSSANGTSGWTNTGSNSNTLATGNLTATTYYKCKISCATGSAVDSTPVYTLTVNSSVTPGVSISSNNTTICNGGTVTLTATPTNGGTAPAYTWKDGTATLASNTTSATFTTAGLATGPHNLTCTITSNAACVSPATATSTSVTVTANAAVALGLFLTNNSGGNSVSAPIDTMCSGSSVLFTANQVNGGTTPTYIWKKGSVAIDTTATDTVTINGISNNDVITCVMISNTMCPSTPSITSGGIVMHVLSTVVPSVTIAGPANNTACLGAPVTFTATPVNGGTVPLYTWYKGTSQVGTGGAAFTDNSAANGDVVTCIMTSTAACPAPATDTSNAITMIVTPSVTPDVTIAAAPGNSICQGTSVTYTATPTNGGTIPSYAWYKGNNPVGTNSISYTDNGIVNGDLISCIMTTTANCATKPTDTSNIVTMAVNPAVTPTVSISANPGTTVTATQTVTFTATVTNGGTTPVYQWKKNGVNVGTSANTYVSNSFVNGDSITCTVHSTELCANPDSVKSNKLVMQVTTGIHQTANANGTVNLFPNPNNGSFTITGTQFTAKEATLEITNIVGQVIDKEVMPLNNGTLNKEVVLPSAQAAGVYLVRIRTENTEDIIRFVIN